jgi:hypothetical protein
VDSLTLIDCKEVLYSHYLAYCRSAAYSEFCFSSHDILGCIGLRNTQYAILNRQYSPEDYRELRAQIVTQMQQNGEWGEFFPSRNSPFAYNESVAGEYMPLSESEVRERGLRWLQPKSYSPPKTTPRMPSDLRGTIEQLSGATYFCKDTFKPYKILAQEIAFCNQMQLALPELCPDRRHDRRMAKRRTRKLVQVSCTGCGRPELSAQQDCRVLCAECYQRSLQ